LDVAAAIAVPVSKVNGGRIEVQGLPASGRFKVEGLMVAGWREVESRVM